MCISNHFYDDDEKIGCILRLNTEYRKFEQSCILD